jgi:2-phospho-L-lactate guanylyltransferase
MLQVVVPHRGPLGKSRLRGPRGELVEAMLADVLAACVEVGSTTLVAPAQPAPPGVELVEDPGGGQGAAVAAALARLSGPVLVVNSDVPCVTPADLRALAAAIPAGGAALVEAADGTTNALGLASPELFRPLYGPGSAARFRSLGAVAAAIPNLADDVDTLDDLRRLRPRVGPRTAAILGLAA